MAVTRAEKEQELQDLTAAFKARRHGDPGGLPRPERARRSTELRRQIRGARRSTRSSRTRSPGGRAKGTRLASLEAHFEGTTASPTPATTRWRWRRR